MYNFQNDTNELSKLIIEWESKLNALPIHIITNNRNSQNRTIKEILGHLVDSASNNIHRIVHLQYQVSPLVFPNYSANGNNDRWIAIQNYQNENWIDLVNLWKYTNLHLIHVIHNVDYKYLQQEWLLDSHTKVSLEYMITDYLPHFKLHLNEIDELINR